MATSKGTAAKTKAATKETTRPKTTKSSDKGSKETKKVTKPPVAKEKEAPKDKKPVAAAKPKEEKPAQKEVKPAVKPAEKPAVKAASKPTAKAASKPAPKAAAKPATKADAKQTDKAAAKPAPRAAKQAPKVAEAAAATDTPVTKEVSKKTPLAGIKDKWHEMRQLLTDMKQDTLLDIRRSLKTGAEILSVEETTGDIYDQASSERERELGLLLGDREREKLFSIDEALLRMADGDYGICEECDEDIPMGRLKVMPFTRHCVKCKGELEKIQAQTRRTEEERVYREIPGGGEEEEG